MGRSRPVDVALSSAAPSVTAGTGTGTTRVRVPKDTTYQVRTSAQPGTAQAEVPDTPGAPHVVDARADTGTATVSFG